MVDTWNMKRHSIRHITLWHSAGQCNTTYEKKIVFCPTIGRYIYKFITLSNYIWYGICQQMQYFKYESYLTNMVLGHNNRHSKRLMTIGFEMTSRYIKRWTCRVPTGAIIKLSIVEPARVSWNAPTYIVSRRATTTTKLILYSRHKYAIDIWQCYTTVDMRL
jgi:hypothetical protein